MTQSGHLRSRLLLRIMLTVHRRVAKLTIARSIHFGIFCVGLLIVSPISAAEELTRPCSAELQTKVMDISEALSNANPTPILSLPGEPADYKVCGFLFPNPQARLTFRVFVARDSSVIFIEERILHADDSSKEEEIVKLYGPFDPSVDLLYGLSRE